MILKQNNLTRSKIVVKYRNDLIPLIYDKKRHCVITVLTWDMLSASEQAMIGAVGECSVTGMAS